MFGCDKCKKEIIKILAPWLLNKDNQTCNDDNGNGSGDWNDDRDAFHDDICDDANDRYCTNMY